jgi:acyl-homoserine lactone acylase PvdQ
LGKGGSQTRFRAGSLILVLILAAALAALWPLGAAAKQVPPGGIDDFAGQAFNVLPPGEGGTLFPAANSTDQLPLYDGLTPLFDSVTEDDLSRFYKPNVLGLAGATPQRTEQPPARPGLRIDRDSFGVPHVFADDRADVMYGAGWVAAEDRGLLMDIFRGPGRIAALDVPGVNAFAAATSLRNFQPTPETEQFLESQVSLFEQAGPAGTQVLADIDNYIAGINDFLARSGTSAPWTRADVLGVAALIGSVFGRGGGDEVRRSEFLSALQQRLGAGEGGVLWNDLREIQDPEAPVTTDHPFDYGKVPKHPRGNAVVDDGSLDTSGAHAAAVDVASRRSASNALLVSAKRSANGHPLFVAGPQVGYFYPQVLMEMDLEGGGVNARGAVFPGSGPYVELGRGKDFSWSATSAGSDIIDQYVERLCGDDTHYLFKGECREMTTFNAGVLGPGGGHPAESLSFKETVHGPVLGYATVNGERVAISQKRSTRGREGLSALGFSALNSNQVDSSKSFFDAANKIDFTFNWFYADDKDIAMFSSGRLPVRPRKVDPGLPTLGTGQYEWRGFLKENKHAHVVNPEGGVLANWNNKPAERFAASDSNWSYGSVQRVQLLQDAAARHDVHTLASLVGAMNRAATQDLRVMRVLPSIADVLHTGPAPTARAAAALGLLEGWRAGGGSRLDLDLDGKIDNPGAAVMDAAWTKIADAVMSPVMGPQLEQLASLIARDQNASSQGSSYQEGWYGYVDKDLRTLLGEPVDGPFATRFCGQGDLGACRNSLWAALDTAAAQLEATQGPNPAAWRASALRERIRFEPAIFLTTTMRWANRPTFQQVMSFTGHR